MTNEHGSGILAFLRATHFGRVLLIGFLIILLHIPVGMIDSTVTEREMTSGSAGEEITSKWGLEQTLSGPSILIPYVKSWEETLKDGSKKIHRDERYAKFLPGTLKVKCRVDSEVRYRGIFTVPVYSASLDFSGEFEAPDFSGWSIGSDEILWDRAVLSVGVADARAITTQMSVNLNGRVFDFLPGVADPSQPGAGGIHVEAGAGLKSGGPFGFTMQINGSKSLFLTPLGKTTSVSIESDWPDPSFQGAWLPAEREVTGSGFKASWSIPFLGRNFPQRWRLGDVDRSSVDNALFGVRLIQPVDLYRMASRSVKYAVLFIVMTFLALWLFEVLGSARIHSIQYLMVGSALCVFYLLELSLAEHIGFGRAYLAAAAAVVLMLTGYSGAILGAWKRAFAMMAVISGLYGYLYILLSNQDYALLVGAIGLFVTLGAVMFLTRRVDWGGAN